MVKNFIEWLQAKEAVDQHYLWSDDDIPVDKTEKDYLGLPKLTRPGFRKQDKNKITSGKDQVEEWLNGDSELWSNASGELTSIVVRALKNCTYSNTGRPIYATYKSLTTEP